MTLYTSYIEALYTVTKETSLRIMEEKYKLDRVEHDEFDGYNSTERVQQDTRTVCIDEDPEGCWESATASDETYFVVEDGARYKIQPTNKYIPNRDLEESVTSIHVSERELIDRYDGGAANFYELKPTLGSSTWTEFILGESLRGTQYVTGSDGREKIYVETSADVVVDLGGGADQFYGGDGNDWIFGDFDGDIYDGGGGINTLDYSRQSAWQVDLENGTISVDLVDYILAAGDPSIQLLQTTFSNIQNYVGSSANEIILGSWEANKIIPGGGFDTIDGRGHRNAFWDSVDYSYETEGQIIHMITDYADNPNPVEYYYNQSAAIADVVLNVEGIFGSDHDDEFILYGNYRADVIFAGGGHDTLNLLNFDYQVSIDMETYTTGKVRWGSSEFGRDFTLTVDNFESFIGTAFADTINGGAYDETFYYSGGGDQIDGGNGFDIMDYSNATEAVWAYLDGELRTQGSATGDMLTGIEKLIGSDFNDILSGSDSNDILEGRGGADAFFGNGGVDTVTYENAKGSVSLSLAGAGWRGEANGDTFAGIEKVIGSSYDDVLQGTSGDDILDGGRGGGDTIKGWGGNDTIYATSYTDFSNYDGIAPVSQLWGGAGADTFVFSRVGASIEAVIKDFEQGTDIIDLSAHGIQLADGEFREDEARMFSNSGGTLLYIYGPHYPLQTTKSQSRMPSSTTMTLSFSRGPDTH